MMMRETGHDGLFVTIALVTVSIFSDGVGGCFDE